MNNLFTYLNIINCIKSQGEGIIETLIPDFQYKPHKHFNNIELYNTCCASPAKRCHGEGGI